MVVLLTDDQRFDTLWAMPLLQQELVARGVHFEQAFVTTPMCCPARASLLSGGFLARETGVVDNDAPNGGAATFRDASTLATRLQSAGYATGLIGKYLNHYDDLGSYVPPGWTLWYGALGIALGPSAFVVGSSGALPGTGTFTPTIHQYGTDHLRDQALAFLDAHSGGPFFLYLSFGAPHTPATPASADASLFPTYLYRGRAYAEPDLSDKPPRVAIAAPQFAAIAAQQDAFHRDQLRTLQAVDRAVAAIVDRLEALEVLDDTVIVYLSDNGYLWGEHHLTGKGDAYQESIRVPLVVVAPGITPRSDGRLVAANLDVAATVLDAAGLVPGGQGQSLLPLLTDPGLPGRGETLLEQAQPWRVWSGLRARDAGGDWKYVEDSYGERELYDLAADPYEEQNLAHAPAYQGVVADLAARLAPQRALAITTRFTPPYTVGQPYAAAIERWGGVGPFSWSVAGGALPAGLSLDSATGVVSGVPTQTLPSSVQIRVTDTAIAAHSGEPYTYAQQLVFGPPACSDTLDNDGDTKVDLVDPGCSAAGDVSETSPGAPCDDALDNDLDDRIDHADPGCRVAPYDNESRRPGCGIGVELLALALLAPRAARRSAGRSA